MPVDSETPTLNQQTKEFYEAAGQFVVSFETMVFLMQSSIRSQAREGGLGPGFEYVTNAILAELTAMQTLRAYRSIVRNAMEGADEESNNILSKIAKNIVEIIEERNAFIHSTSFVGHIFAHDADNEDAYNSGLVPNMKAQNTSAGVRFNPKTIQASDLRDHARRCSRTSTALTLAATCVRNRIPISSRLKISDKEVVRCDGNVT